MNYFELFGLPVAPSVEKSLISAKYFELQRKNHPDFFTQATEMEKEDSLKLSADINKAFAVFSDEQRTIEYFLQLKGTITENEKYNLPPDFLMEMLELNEALSDAEQAVVVQRVEAYEDSLYTEIKPILTHYNSETPGDDLLKLKEYYYKKKYLNRILDRLDD